MNEVSGIPGVHTDHRWGVQSVNGARPRSHGAVANLPLKRPQTHINRI